MATSAGGRDTTSAAESAPGNGALGLLAAGFAHEVRNPLNTLVLTIEFLERVLSREKLERREDIARHLAAASRDAARMQKVIEAFVELARPRSFAPESIDLAKVLADGVRAGSTAAGKPGRKIALRAASLEWRADVVQLKAALAAIVANAIEASADGGAIEARLERTAAGAVRLAVTDEGPGLTDAARSRVPEPFFTTKPGHMGIGLARARLVAVAHGGRLTIAPGPRGGSEVALELGPGNIPDCRVTEHDLER